MMNKKRLKFVICLWIALACCSPKRPADSIVYVTNTGNKYHTVTCRYLGQSALPVSLPDACSRYGPCSDCDPPLCTESAAIEKVEEVSDNVSSSTQSESFQTAAVRCSGITKKGKQCKRQTKDADGRCYQHKN